MAALKILEGTNNESPIANRASLFDLQAELDQIAGAFDQLEDGGEDQAVLAAIEQYFSDLLDRRDDKIDAYCRLYRAWLADSEACRLEAHRIAKRAQARLNRAERLKTRLHEFLKENEIQRLSTPLNTVRRQANGGALPVHLDLRAEQLPESYQRVSVEADLAAIGKALLAGYEIVGARLGERGEHLRID